MIRKIPYLLFILITLAACETGSSARKGFIHASGTSIVDGQGREIMLRGFGLGGWMLQEGYMLETSDFAGTQWQIKQKISEVAGQQGMEDFYKAWLSNHVTHRDIDSLAAWGFNSVRPALHYNLFTLPIEDEPTEGHQTWLDEGFLLLDLLIEWCAANRMYVILDLHAAPGGQGRDNNIADRDPSKPSLWQSDANQIKTVELWRKLAERYHDNPWVGGYDLINEPNWDFEHSAHQNGCNCEKNEPLLKLYQDIITAVRSVDQNHLIFIEGNCWAGNFNGLHSLAKFDDNIAFSFHRYWNPNSTGSIREKLELRDQLNIPLWMGESGENSNHWFAEAIALLESNNIGWAWWPVKKINSVVGPMTVVKTPAYEELLQYWRHGGSPPDQGSARATLMQIADNLLIENCQIHYDVIDALIRQPHTNETIPFKTHKLPGTILAVDYDMGKNGAAYHDNDFQNTGGAGSSQWNQGWTYRNDGVDIYRASESPFDIDTLLVGSLDRGEWLAYTFTCDSEGLYAMELQVVSGARTGSAYIHIDDMPAGSKVMIPPADDALNHTTLNLGEITLNAGTHRMTFHVEQGGFRLHSFSFNDVKP